MATSVEELVDMLFTMIDEAASPPLSRDKCVIDRGKALDLLDDIRDQMPVELSEARKLVNNRNEYLAAAKRDADEIRRRAEAEARQMVDTDKVMNAARQKATEVVRQAEGRSKELKHSANEYCEDLLRRTEEAISEALSEARRARTNFRAAANMGRAADSAAPAKGGRVFDVEAQG